MPTQRSTDCPECGKPVSLGKRVVYEGPIEEMNGVEFCGSDCLLDAYEKFKDPQCPSSPPS